MYPLDDVRAASKLGKCQSDLDVTVKALHFFPSEPIAIFPFLTDVYEGVRRLLNSRRCRDVVSDPSLRDPATATLQRHMAMEVANTPGSLTTFIGDQQPPGYL